ncbi:DUF6879 family protein [Agrobacterium burrii]
MEFSSISQHSLLTPSPISELGKAFRSFKKNAFRLEMLPAYDVPSEKEAFSAYLAREEKPLEFNESWYSILKESQNRQATVKRVRVIDNKTSYIDFEIDWGYKTSITFGESIKTITSKEVRKLSEETGLLFIKDFWIFDEERVFVMDYDFFGRFLGVLTADGKIAKLFQTLSQKLENSSQEFL